VQETVELELDLIVIVTASNDVQGATYVCDRGRTRENEQRGAYLGYLAVGVKSLRRGQRLDIANISAVLALPLQPEAP
jgi:hypothetical protein